MQNQWGEEVDQWGNPVSGGPYLPPNYYPPDDSPYEGGGYGGQQPYYPGSTPEPPTTDPEQPYQPPYTNDNIPDPPKGGTPTEPQFTGDVRAYIMALLGSGPSSMQKLLEIRPKIQALGGRADVQVASDGTARGRIMLPDGREVTMIGDGQTWGSPWAWREGNTGGGGGGGTTPTVDDGGRNEPVPINPEYLTPWTESTPTKPTYKTFQSPGDFNAPTAESMLKDPSYLWRLSQGQGALENSAAARGTLNSGGTLKDILNYGQKAGSQEYSSIWGRDFDKWASDWGNALTAFKSDKDVLDSDYDNATKDWTTRRDTFYSNQNNPWKKYIESVNTGAGA